MEQYKQEFIEFMIDCNVLKFGDFVTKSGRKTPFFVNTGFYRTLAVSIAESLNVTAVLGRRARLHYGLGVLILCFAVGKALGSLLFFYKHWF